MQTKETVWEDPKNVVLFIQTNPKSRLSTQKAPHKHIEIHHINDKTINIIP